jgi:site-specific recombinase XerD
MASLLQHATEEELLQQLRELRMGKLQPTTTSNEMSVTNHTVSENTPPTTAISCKDMTSKSAKKPSKHANEPSNLRKGCAISSSPIYQIGDISSSIHNLARRDVRPSPERLHTSHWTEVIEDFIEAVANSDRTRKRYRSEVRKLEAFVGPTIQPEDLKKDHYQRYAKHVLSKGLAINTNRSYLIPIKSFASFLMQKYDRTYNAGSVIKLEKKVRTKEDIIVEEEIEDILCDTIGKKQEFVAMLYFAGLRIFEVCKVKYKDIVLETKQDEFATSMQNRKGFRRSNKPKETTELTITVVGKGNKKRTIAIGSRGRFYLEHLARHEKKDSYVFPGRDPRCPMSKRTGQYWVKKICRDRMVDEFQGKTKITAHMFRRTLK